MPFKLFCPNGHPIMIHDQHVGRRVKCPACGEGVLAVRPEGAAVASSAPLAQPVPDEAPTPRTPPRPVPVHVPEPEPDEARPETPTRSKKTKRRAKRIEMTRGLALISTGLWVQIGRIVFLALSSVVGFGAVFSPLSMSYAGLGVGVAAHLLGVAVAGLCLGGSKQTGGRPLIIGSLVTDLIGMPAGFLIGYFVGGILGAVIGIVVAAVCKLLAWFIFVIYLRTLAGYLGEEADTDLADGLVRFTFILLVEYVLIFSAAVIPGLTGLTITQIARESGFLAWILRLGFLSASVWFLIHCVFYLSNYIQLLLELTDTIRRQGVGLGDMFQSAAAKPERESSSVRDREPESSKPERASSSVWDAKSGGLWGIPKIAWILGGIGAGFVTLVVAGVVTFFLYQRYWSPQAKAAQLAREEFEDRTRPINPGDRDFTVRVLRCLRSTDPPRQLRGIEAIAKTEPGERRAEIAEALLSHISDASPSTRVAALKQYVRFVDREAAISFLLERLAASQDGQERFLAIETLGNLKAERASEPIAARMRDRERNERAQCRKALIAIGPPAEAAVRNVLKNDEHELQREACDILKVIGTQASVAERQEVADSVNRDLANAAKEALANIAARHRLTITERDRTKKPTKDNPPAKPAIPDPPKPREPPAVAKLTSLIAYWDFEEEDEKKALDVSEHAHVGVVHGAKRVPGARGKALQFADERQWFDYGRSPQFNFESGAGFTFACWVKTTELSGTILAQRKEADASPSIHLFFEIGTLTATVREDGDEFGESARVRGPVMNDGQWHHVALVRDASTVELFMNGKAVGKAVSPNAGGSIKTDLRSLASERYLATRRGPEEYAFKGALDEFCIFGRALNANEISTLAQTRD